MTNSKDPTLDAEAAARRARAFDIIPGGVLILDVNGVVLDTNATGPQALGVPKSELVGKPIWTLADRSPRNAGIEKRAVLAAGKGEAQTYLLEVDTPMGRLFIESTATPYRGADGEVAFVFVHGQNATERFRARREVDEKQGQLDRALNDLSDANISLIHSEKLATVGRFTAGLAHEVNNPLSTAKVAAGELSRRLEEIDDLDEGSRAQLLELTEMLERSVSRAGDAVQTVARLSRHDSDDYEPVDLRPGIEDALGLMSFRRAHCELRNELEPLPPVWARAGDLSHVWLNAIDNAQWSVEMARRADGSGTGFLRVYADVTDDSVTVTFEDNGLGIDEESLRFAFEPFFTTKPAGEGTGLGLAICKRIVDAHQGEVSIRTEDGVTRFRVRLPRAPKRPA